jgi:hypothetical protein
MVLLDRCGGLHMEREHMDHGFNFYELLGNLSHESCG